MRPHRKIGDKAAPATRLQRGSSLHRAHARDWTSVSKSHNKNGKRWNIPFFSFHIYRKLPKRAFLSNGRMSFTKMAQMGCVHLTNIVYNFERSFEQCDTTTDCSLLPRHVSSKGLQSYVALRACEDLLLGRRHRLARLKQYTYCIKRNSKK